MINRKKDILKRNYIAPTLFVEQAEPWELMAGSGGDIDIETSPGGNNDDPFGGPAKSNFFFEQYSNDFEETTEE